MRKVLFFLFASVILTGCKFSRSVEKDLISGLTSAGKDLSCGDVYLKVNDERVSGNKFTYGETIYIYFDDVKGFANENGNVFPGMSVSVTGIAGDTVLSARDLYEGYTEGMNFSPLQLSADLTLADPVRSNADYKLEISIWDKKGTGTFRSELQFNVAENENITAKAKDASCSEIYLFSQGNNKVITDNIVSFDDNIYIIIEGLKGFSEENGLVFPGMQLNGTDSRGETILEYDDLFQEYSGSGIAASDFSSRVSAHFRLTGAVFNNPLTCELKIWDKKSNASLTVTTEMIVK